MFISYTLGKAIIAKIEEHNRIFLSNLKNHPTIHTIDRKPKQIRNVAKIGLAEAITVSAARFVDNVSYP